MAKLIYSGIMSLDGYTVDENGSFEWAAPDAEVHGFVNELERQVGTYLYGRRMYETMTYWETFEHAADAPAVAVDYAGIWRAADKIVFSRTLDAPTSAKTRIVREFHSEAIRTLKESAALDISIGGPTLAAAAVAAGLVDEFQYFLTPVVVGGGTAFLPDDVRFDLELLDERRFASGVVYLRYRTR